MPRTAGHRCLTGAAAALGTAVILVLTPLPTQALELFGLCVLGTCEREPADSGLIDPKPYAVSLTVEGGDEELEQALRAASALWVNRDEPAAGSAGLLARARADYRRLLAALYNEARYGGEISIIADGRQVSDLPAGHDFADGTRFDIRVVPSPSFTFGQLAIDKPPPRTTDPFDRVDDPADIGFVTGAPARAGIVRRAGELTLEGWRQQGHPTPEIVNQDVVANHPDRLLRVLLNIDPGPRAVFGDVGVSGTQRMIPSFVARQTGLVAGREYDPDDLERARERLQRLGVFNAVSVEGADAVGADGRLPINVTVDERKLRRIGVGVTTSTIDGFGAEAFWLHRNLFGRAERLRVEASVSGVESTLDAGNYDYRLGATLGLPGRFTPDTDITIKALASREEFESYTATGGEVSVGAVHYQSTRLTYNGSLFAHYAEFDDAAGTRRLGVVGISGGATYDTRDDELDPTEGFFLSGTATPFYEWEFGNGALQLDGEARVYTSFGKARRTVLAGRLKAGSIIGSSTAELPPNRLYFAGGGASVRGFAHRSIGGNSSRDVGGKSLLEVSGEVRQSVTDKFAVVGFVDAALVGLDSTPDFSEAPRVGAGVGVRYQTGLGPLRVDVAAPLNRRPGDAWIALYAGIGQAF